MKRGFLGYGGANKVNEPRETELESIVQRGELVLSLPDDFVYIGYASHAGTKAFRRVSMEANVDGECGEELEDIRHRVRELPY